MYLLRLDDAAPNWDSEKWRRMYELLKKYGVHPIIAIIPHNEDTNLLRHPEDISFLETIRKWIEEGWTPALHGYSHKYIQKCGGINPVNNYSEFAGVNIEEQKEKIEKGCRIFEEWGIEHKIFVAPAHTFDRQTLSALRSVSDIRIISDTVASDIYYKDGFYFIPQQCGSVRKMAHLNALTTFCYHPNTMTEASFETLESFLRDHADNFSSFDQLTFTDRKRSLYDIILSFVYFTRRWILRLVE